jgi:hypothetical protein
MRTPARGNLLLRSMREARRVGQDKSSLLDLTFSCCDNNIVTSSSFLLPDSDVFQHEKRNIKKIY